MHLIYRKKVDAPYWNGKYQASVLCPDCYSRKLVSWRDVARYYTQNYEKVFVTKDAFTCCECHSRIQDLAEYEPAHTRREYNFYKPNQVCRYDTRRFNAAGKMIGGHHGHPWGWKNSNGSYYKTLLHRVERRYWNRYAKAMLDDPEQEPNVSTGSMISIMSEVSWKLW